MIYYTKETAISQPLPFCVGDGEWEVRADTNHYGYSGEVTFLDASDRTLRAIEKLPEIMELLKELASCCIETPSDEARAIITYVEGK